MSHSTVMKISIPLSGHLWTHNLSILDAMIKILLHYKWPKKVSRMAASVTVLNIVIVKKVCLYFHYCILFYQFSCTKPRWVKVTQIELFRSVLEGGILNFEYKNTEKRGYLIGLVWCRSLYGYCVGFFVIVAYDQQRNVPISEIITDY